MVVKHFRSPLLTVWNAATTTTFGITAPKGLFATDFGYDILSGTKLYTPKINGKLLQITTSFSTADDTSSFGIAVRDLASTNVCAIAQCATNKAAAIRWPRFFPMSAGSTTGVHTIAGFSGGITEPIPVDSSLEASFNSLTSGDTCFFEVFWETDK